MLCCGLGRPKFAKRLAVDPLINGGVRKPPTPTDLKSWNLPRRRELVDGSLRDLQVLGDFGDRQDAAPALGRGHVSLSGYEYERAG